jgi:hypothetical protein
MGILLVAWRDATEREEDGYASFVEVRGFEPLSRNAEAGLLRAQLAY